MRLPVLQCLHLGVELLLEGVVILCFIAWFLTLCVPCNRANGTRGTAAKVNRERGGERARSHQPCSHPSLPQWIRGVHTIFSESLGSFFCLLGEVMLPSTAATVLQHLSTVRVDIPYATFQAQALAGGPVSCSPSRTPTCCDSASFGRVNGYAAGLVDLEDTCP